MDTRREYLKVTVWHHYIAIPAVPTEDRIFFIQEG